MKTSKKSTGLPIALAMGLTFGANSANAASYIGSTYEGFDYPAAVLGTANGGTGFNSTGDKDIANTSAWAGAAATTVTPGSLSYTAAGYASPTGNKLSLDGTSGSTSALRNVGQTVATDTVGSMYFSFLLQKTNTTNRSLNLAFFDGGVELFAVGQNQNGIGGQLGALGVNIQTSSSSFLSYPSSPLALDNSVHLILGKMDYTTGNDTLTLWVNPTDVTGGEGSLTVYHTVAIASKTNAFNIIRPFAGGPGSFGFATGNFDEIRLGSSFESVIPEPSTALLGGLGVLALLRRRRI